MKQITSTANDRIKEIVKLHNARERRQSGQIIIEGSREITLALEQGLEIIELYFCPELYHLTVPTIENCEVCEVNLAVFQKIAYKESPEGIIAIAKPVYLTLTDLKLSANPLLIILEKIEKPGNLGAILRTAYAADVETVIVNDPLIDIYNPNVIRSSMGRIFSVPTIVAERQATVDWLKKHHIKSFAASTQGSKFHWQSDLSAGTTIVLGTENSGLSKDWLDAADEHLKIPMRDDIDSLNVSVSAAVITYEALRQRSLKK